MSAIIITLALFSIASAVGAIVLVLKTDSGKRLEGLFKGFCKRTEAPVISGTSEEDSGMPEAPAVYTESAESFNLSDGFSEKRAVTNVSSERKSQTFVSVKKNAWVAEVLNKTGEYCLDSVRFTVSDCRDRRFLIGRVGDDGSVPDICFRQTSVSRLHAQIIYDDDKEAFVLIDDWSVHGTFTGSSYNPETDEYTPGKKINNVTITDGLVVWLADVPIRFKKSS